MCCVELPPGPKQLFEEAGLRYLDVERRVVRGEASWIALTKAQQREMNQVIGFLRSAAEQGHAGAQFNIGDMYRQGQGVKDLTEAVRRYRKAASQGNANAQVSIGLMYVEGLGVKKDSAEAVRWYLKAAV